ncbi:acetoacetate decarboxylase family protein [Conyzicola nivalis]|uniref:Acetoacetate decarboxylase n=1 Tax=Conyzicola nivalis TaxID=1477021 RepID=A0A916SKQ3_9MICO|nr:acetoacetate decarboxylase family protein [Conyzicola nivalis]GGB02214.1 acetoacetate decarboxylase [Conyzicola nivalis]
MSDAVDVSYPPEPWFLGGSLCVSVFLVPIADLPFATLPMIRLGRHAIVGAAFANYAPGGVLAYDELLVATPVVVRGRARITIPQIWVDSAESLAGGRALWGIPKHLATFDSTRTTDAATVSARTIGPIAALSARFGRALLPGSPRLPLPIEQRRAGRRIVSHNWAAGRLTALHARWTFDPDGPLGYLHGRRPVANFAVRDAAIVFGQRVERP